MPPVWNHAQPDVADGRLRRAMTDPEPPWAAVATLLDGVYTGTVHAGGLDADAVYAATPLTARVVHDGGAAAPPVGRRSIRRLRKIGLHLGS